MKGKKEGLEWSRLFDCAREKIMKSFFSFSLKSQPLGCQVVQIVQFGFGRWYPFNASNFWPNRTCQLNFSFLPSFLVTFLYPFESLNYPADLCARGLLIAQFLLFLCCGKNPCWIFICQYLLSDFCRSFILCKKYLFCLCELV